MYKQKNKGFALIELIVAMGFISVSSITLYSIANIVNDYRKSSSETKSLNQVIKNIDLSIIDFSKVTLSSLDFNSSLRIDNIDNNNDKLNFIYENVNTRICNDFSSKMISSNKNISININNTDIKENDLKSISNVCVLDNNKVVISLSKSADYTIDTVVASVNPPAAPTPDIVIPTFGGSTALPNVPMFVPSTASPVTYPLTIGTPPTFGPVVGGGGAITVNTPSSPITPSNPSVSNWNPPYVYIPPATPAPLDVIDQDPNPPPPPPPPPPPTFYSKQIKACSHYTGFYSPYDCNVTYVYITMTLTLASPLDTQGKVKFIFPYGVDYCNAGEPGFYLIFSNLNYPINSEHYWHYGIYGNKMPMPIKAFENVSDFIFTCAQTGGE